MRYISPRRGPDTPTRSFCDILLEGLAPDGGLYLPEEYPTLDGSDLDTLRGVLAEEGYAAMAARILALFVDDIPAEDLNAIAARAYRTPAFSDRARQRPGGYRPAPGSPLGRPHGRVQGHGHAAPG